MPTYRVVTFQCPRCKTDIGRRFGLIMSKMIVCPSCGTNVRVDANVIQQNWAFNFGWVGGLLFWFVLGALVIADPQLAASVGNKTFKSNTGEQRLIIAAMCGIPALFAGLLIGLVGAVIGTIVTAGEPAPATSQPPGAPLAPPEPQGRGCLIRAFFIMAWPIVFFFAAMIVMMCVDGVITEKDPEVSKQLSKQSAERNSAWMSLSTLGVFVIGCFGLLPWTGKGKKKVPPSSGPPDRPQILSGGPRNPYGL